MFDTLLPDDRKNLSTSANIPFTLCDRTFDITQGIFSQREANSILVGGIQERITQTGFPLQSSGLLPATVGSVTDASLDLLTGEVMSGVYQALTAFATDPNFADKMNVPFGESWDKEKVKALKEEWLRGNFSNIPLVKVVSSGDIGGANGAFGTATNTIYFSKEFLAQNATRLDALTGVLLEEVGHFIDSQVNQFDSPGDEGEIFAAVVQGKDFSQEKLQVLKAEDDQAIALIEGKEISIEQAANTVTVSATDASAAEVVSGQTANPGMYRISRTESTTAPLTVTYTMSGTSLNRTDYTSLNGTATIPAGETFVDVALNITDDTLIESNETAILTLSTSTNYTVGATNTATVTIADNDQNTVTVSATDTSAAEVISGQTTNPGMYRISRTGSTTASLNVPYTMSGTATNGTDYTSLNGTATIPAGETFVDVALNITDDTLIESNETAILTLSTSTNYTVGATNTATVTIADNDQNTVTVSATDTSAAEVISGQTTNPGMYRISRTGSTTASLNVPYTMSGTATNGTDYTSLNGTATIPAGETFVDVALNITDDTLIESNETAILTLSTSTNYTVGATNTATVTIADNDQNTVTVSATDTSAAEVISGQTTNPGMYRISRTGSTTASLNVPYTMSGTATNGTDYTSLNGTATIPAGETFVDVQLNVTDDTLIESNETAILTLSTSTNYTVGATNTATVTIADNDQNTVTIANNNLGAPPDNAGNSPSAARQVTVGSTSTTWSDWVGTEDSNDYYKFTLANSSNFSLSLNGLSSDADVQLLDSTGISVIQGSALGGPSAESISTVLSPGAYYVRVYPYSGSTNYNLSMSAVPNLSTVTVSATDASAAEVVSGQTANPGMYRISRTGSTSAALNVPYTMSGTATNGTDYTSLNGTATIAAGQTFVDVQLNVTDDTLIESNETAILTLSTSSNYTVGATNTATVTIADNDLADWFDQNIQDIGLRSTARLAASDGLINRNEMIGILRDAKDGSVIDSTELANLRSLLTSNTRPFSILDSVQNLTNKVVNGDLANQTYQGSYLGNLSANSSATQMENLINKWFLGLDRPTTPYTYQYASGSLFHNGVSYEDINQGLVADCYYLASLAGTAFRSPTTIQNMFADNGDNTYTVRFYKDGVTDYVTVDRYLPTSPDFFGGFPYAKTLNSELWVALAEKAYAQVNQSGWIQQDGTNNYSGIDYGSGSKAIGHVTGRNTDYQWFETLGVSIDINAIITAFNAGQIITVGSKGSGVASNVVSRHEYALVGYNSLTQKFTLYNPHGVNSAYSSRLDLSASELSKSFLYWGYTTENGLPASGNSGSLPPEFGVA
ncbi:MAG: Calx-beta domain-containing protein [Microcoleus sp.]